MKKKFRTGEVIAVSAAHLLHDTYSSFLAPLLPLLIEKLGISMFLAGLLDVIRKIPSLFNPFIGLLADRISVRYFVILAPTLTAVSMSLLGLSPNYIVLMILILMAGVGSALFHVPAPVLVKHASGETIGKGMSFYMVGGELARTLGPLAILAAVSLWGLEGTWRLIPFGLTASVVLFAMFRKFSFEEHRQRNREKESLSKELKIMFLSLAGILFFRAGMKAALTIYLPTYLTAQGSSIWMAGAALSILQFAGAAGTLLAGTISDKIGRRFSLIIMAIVSPILMLGFLFSPPIWKIPILIITGIFLFGSGPVMLSVVHNLNHKNMAFINGIYITLNFVLSSIMIMLVGLSSDKLGLNLTYLISALVAVLAVPSALILKNDKIIS